MSFIRLKEREIKNLFLVIEEELKLIKEDIKNLKNINIPEKIKLRIKILEVKAMGIEEQIVSIEDRMRIIETNISALQGAFSVANNNLTEQITIINNKIIAAKSQFNASLQALDDKKLDKIVEETEL